MSESSIDALREALASATQALRLFEEQRDYSEALKAARVVGELANKIAKLSPDFIEESPYRKKMRAEIEALLDAPDDEEE